MKKVLLLLKDLEIPGIRTIWQKGKMYDVIFENQNVYLLKEQNGIVCGFDKADCGETYEIREIQDEIR